MSNFRRLGVMLDMSRNGVMTVDAVKRFLRVMNKMGYNCLELYTEDTYEIEGEPFFGYLRGRYTATEIKEIDAYAKSLGIELIPCIQTLAHFTAVVRHFAYKDIVDINDILLADEEKTYALIEKMFQTLANNFSSRLVNIGMDEAHMVGLGKYFDKHGLVDRTELLLRHLNKVAEIAKKYGFRAHMWSDMFYRLANGGHYHGSGVSTEIASKIPSNVDLVYWDYYHDEKAVYDKAFDSHQAISPHTWFAGGAWTWNGFAPMNRWSLQSMKPAIQSAREKGVQDVLITMWGDNGRECSPFALLPSLYAISEYAKGNFDEESIKKGFAETFQLQYDDFMALDILFETEEYKNEKRRFDGISKTFFYCDPFVGIFDKDIEIVGQFPYGKYAEELEKAKFRAGEYAYIFDDIQALCEVIQDKTTLGVRTRKAYKAGDKKTLTALVDEYQIVLDKIKRFHKTHYTLWHKECKPQGWEVQDLRMGGLMQRITTCKERLTAYLNGELPAIAELEEEIVMVHEEPDMRCNWWQYLASNSLI